MSSTPRHGGVSRAADLVWLWIPVPGADDHAEPRPTFVGLGFPEPTLGELARRLGLRPERPERREQVVDDPVLVQLALTLAPVIADPCAASQFFAANLVCAAAAHWVGRKSLVRSASLAKGGLAPWQLQRATALLSADLEDDVCLDVVADACRLSLRHFTRAFTQSAGVSPHRFRLQKRVERAKTLLATPEPSLGAVGAALGFSSQSRFTLVFAKYAGVSPGVWRRQHLERTGLQDASFQP